MPKTETTPERITPEYMRAWEERLGPEKMQRAISIAQLNGWQHGSNPPMWVWAQIYLQVEDAS